MQRDPNFLAGVIEGFYGPPWTRAERLELSGWLRGSGLNSYLYAPKDDLKQRAAWREDYTSSEAAALRELAAECQNRGLRFIYAVSPGLDIRYSSPADLNRLKARLTQMLGLGCRDFCLLFDDIPDQMHPEDASQFGSLAAAQAAISNELLRWSRQLAAGVRCLFCPTAYCGRMAAAGLGGPGYLEQIGRELLPEIGIFWTGPEIISREITAAHAREIAALLRRKPVIWENLHANDYDGRRFFCGPYSGRPPEIRAEVAGILANPNNEFPLNWIAVQTLGRFLQAEADWNPRQEYLRALASWRGRFELLRGPIELDDLVPFLDCFYLPHQEGPAAEALIEEARALLTQPPETWGGRASAILAKTARLRDLCLRLPELRDRPLWHAISRRVWDLREELDLLHRFIEFRQRPENKGRPFASDYHLPGTYRGGFVARLQSLLSQCPDGTFRPAAEPPENPCV